MKLFLTLTSFVGFLLFSCKNTSKKEIIQVESARWTLQEVNDLDTTTSNYIPYFQATDTAGNNGYVELKDYGERGQQLRVYDGKGDLIIDSEILDEEIPEGGFEARTIFYNKPDRIKSYELIEKTGKHIRSKDNTVFDPIVKVHGVIRFIPELRASKTLELRGVQFDIPKLQESIYIKFY